MCVCVHMIQEDKKRMIVTYTNPGKETQTDAVEIKFQSLFYCHNVLLVRCPSTEYPAQLYNVHARGGKAGGAEQGGDRDKRPPKITSVSSSASCIRMCIRAHLPLLLNLHVHIQCDIDICKVYTCVCVLTTYQLIRG